RHTPADRILRIFDTDTYRRQPKHTDVAAAIRSTRRPSRHPPRQQKGLTSNTPSPHGPARSSTATSRNRTTANTPPPSIRVRDQEVADNVRPSASSQSGHDEATPRPPASIVGHADRTP